MLLLENHVTVGELLESKSLQQSDKRNAFKSSNGALNWNADSEASQITGGFSLGFSLSVIQVFFKFHDVEWKKGKFICCSFFWISKS